MMRKLLPSWFHLGWKPSRAPTSIIVTFLSLRSPEKSGVSLMPAIFASHNEMVLPVLLIKPLLGASSAFVGMLTRFDLILLRLLLPVSMIWRVLTSLNQFTANPRLVSRAQCFHDHAVAIVWRPHGPGSRRKIQIDHAHLRKADRQMGPVRSTGPVGGGRFNLVHAGLRGVLHVPLKTIGVILCGNHNVMKVEAVIAVLEDAEFIITDLFFPEQRERRFHSEGIIYSVTTVPLSAHDNIHRAFGLVDFHAHGQFNGHHIENTIIFLQQRARGFEKLCPHPQRYRVVKLNVGIALPAGSEHL